MFDFNYFTPTKVADLLSYLKEGFSLWIRD